MLELARATKALKWFLSAYAETVQMMILMMMWYCMSEVRRPKTIKPPVRNNNIFEIQELSKMGHDFSISWLGK